MQGRGLWPCEDGSQRVPQQPQFNPGYSQGPAAGYPSDRHASGGRPLGGAQGSYSQAGPGPARAMDRGPGEGVRSRAGVYGNAGGGAFGADPHRQSQFGEGGSGAWDADHNNGAEYQQGRAGHAGMYGPYGRPDSSVSTMARPDHAHQQQHQQHWAHGSTQPQQQPMSYTQQLRSSQQYAPHSARHPSTAPSSSQQLYSQQQQQGHGPHGNWPSQSQYAGGTQPAYHANGHVNHQCGSSFHTAEGEEYADGEGLEDMMEEEEEEEGHGGYHLGQQQDQLRSLTQMGGGQGGQLGAAVRSGRAGGYSGGGGGGSGGGGVGGGGGGATAAHAYEGGPGSDRLVAVRELPEVFQALFPNYRYFNPVQSECFQEAYLSDVNMVVSAPTGSGKTGVMELALLRLLSKHMVPEGATPGPGAAAGDGGGGSGGRLVLRPPRGTSKAVYVAPLRALVQEKCKEWTERFGAGLGLSVLELSGDTEPSADALEAADLLCTTPEKLDALSRRFNAGSRSTTFMSEVSLLLIDEVHLLHEAERGSALEAGVVSRFAMLATFPQLQDHPISRLRCVAVSATIPNVGDIAGWLRVPARGLKQYGEEMRPVKLRTVVKTYAACKNDFLFERRLDTFLPAVVAEHSSGKPTLIFCSSRKGTVESATFLANAARTAPRRPGAAALPSSYCRDAQHAERLAAAAQRASSKQLQSCLSAGVGFHSAAIEAADRTLVEQLFLAGDLPVLCSTSTLALGVNLPAHLVVIRGTRRYCGADGGGSTGGTAGEGTGTGYREYDRSVCLQMVGRAGRPQFDTEGVAVIMTQKETYARYAGLLSGAEPVESCLGECFPEHLNAEVALHTVRDMDTATAWLRTTFLYIRARREPRAYHLEPPPEAMADAAAFDRWLAEWLVGRAVKELTAVGLVTQGPGGELQSTEPGRIMAHSYIRLNTMRAITQVGPNAGMMSLLRVLAVAEENANIRIRRGEKRILNEINKRVEGAAAIKYPVPGEGRPGPGGAPKPKDRITKVTEKIFIMVNEALSDSNGEALDFSMRQELEQVLRGGQRIAGAMARFFEHRRALAATANALCLTKNLKQRMWDDTAQAARQMPDVGKQSGQRLAAAGLGGLRALWATDPRRIEAVAQRPYPFGNTLRSHVARVLPPEVSLRLALTARGRAELSLELELTRLEPQGAEAAALAAARGSTTPRSPAVLVLGSCHDDRLLRREGLILETFTSPYKVHVSVSPPSRPDQPLHLVACVLLERYCGLDTTAHLRLQPQQLFQLMSGAGAQGAAHHGGGTTVRQVVVGCSGEGGGEGEGEAGAGGGVERAGDEFALGGAAESEEDGAEGEGDGTGVGEGDTAGGKGGKRRRAAAGEASELQPSPFPAAAGAAGAADQLSPMPGGGLVGGPGRLQQQGMSQSGRSQGRGGGAAAAAAAGGAAAHRPQVLIAAPALAAPSFVLDFLDMPGAAPAAASVGGRTPPPPPPAAPPGADLNGDGYGDGYGPGGTPGDASAAAGLTPAQGTATSGPGGPASVAGSVPATATGKAAAAAVAASRVRVGGPAGGGGGAKQQPARPARMTAAGLAGARHSPAFAKLLAGGGSGERHGDQQAEGDEGDGAGEGGEGGDDAWAMQQQYGQQYGLGAVDGGENDGGGKGGGAGPDWWGAEYAPYGQDGSGAEYGVGPGSAAGRQAQAHVWQDGARDPGGAGSGNQAGASTDPAPRVPRTAAAMLRVAALSSRTMSATPQQPQPQLQQEQQQPSQGGGLGAGGTGTASRVRLTEAARRMLPRGTVGALEMLQAKQARASALGAAGASLLYGSGGTAGQVPAGSSGGGARSSSSGGVGGGGGGPGLSGGRDMACNQQQHGDHPRGMPAGLEEEQEEAWHGEGTAGAFDYWAPRGEQLGLGPGSAARSTAPGGGGSAQPGSATPAPASARPRSGAEAAGWGDFMEPAEPAASARRPLQQLQLQQQNAGSRTFEASSGGGMGAAAWRNRKVLHGAGAGGYSGAAAGTSARDSPQVVQGVTPRSAGASVSRARDGGPYGQHGRTAFDAAVPSLASAYAGACAWPSGGAGTGGGAEAGWEQQQQQQQEGGGQSKAARKGASVGFAGGGVGGALGTNEAGGFRPQGNPAAGGKDFAGAGTGVQAGAAAAAAAAAAAGATGPTKYSQLARATQSLGKRKAAEAGQDGGLSMLPVHKEAGLTGGGLGFLGQEGLEAAAAGGSLTGGRTTSGGVNGALQPMQQQEGGVVGEVADVGHGQQDGETWGSGGGAGDEGGFGAGMWSGMWGGGGGGAGVEGAEGAEQGDPMDDFLASLRY